MKQRRCELTKHGDRALYLTLRSAWTLVKLNVNRSTQLSLKLFWKQSRREQDELGYRASPSALSRTERMFGARDSTGMHRVKAGSDTRPIREMHRKGSLSRYELQRHLYSAVREASELALYASISIFNSSTCLRLFSTNSHQHSFIRKLKYPLLRFNI